MDIFLIVLALVGLVLVIERVAVAIRGDGYGTTPPPRSHDTWDRLENGAGHRFV